MKEKKVFKKKEEMMVQQLLQSERKTGKRRECVAGG